jgi:dTDP-4-dehydrorhamnose reductase
MRLFLTGGTGFFGSNVLRVAREQYDAQVFTTINTWRPGEPVDFAFAPVDMTDAAAVAEAVRNFQPDVIVHSAILKDFALMYRDRHLAWRSYVDATRNLTDAANAVGAQIILVSTDWVFDGTQGGADEFTPPNPVNLYGVLKVACERVVMERARRGAVARVSGVNGLPWLRKDGEDAQDSGFGHFMSAVEAGLRRDGRFAVWLEDNVNIRGTPSLASDSAEKIMRIAFGNHSGIFHCTGGESVGRVELAKQVAAGFGHDPEAITTGPVPSTAHMHGVRIPADTSLSATWTSAQLGHPLLTVETIVDRLKTQMTTGRLQ